MINIFFQEWAPLFPVLHRPTFLSLYEQYVTSPDTLTDKKSVAKLNLVFNIAALSSDVRLQQARLLTTLTSTSPVMARTLNRSKRSGKLHWKAS
jgi:hypothetical protein